MIDERSRERGAAPAPGEAPAESGAETSFAGIEDEAAAGGRVADPRRRRPALPRDGPRRPGTAGLPRRRLRDRRGLPRRGRPGGRQRRAARGRGRRRHADPGQPGLPRRPRTAGEAAPGAPGGPGGGRHRLPGRERQGPGARNGRAVPAQARRGRGGDGLLCEPRGAPPGRERRRGIRRRLPRRDATASAARGADRPRPGAGTPEPAAPPPPAPRAREGRRRPRSDRERAVAALAATRAALARQESAVAAAGARPRGDRRCCARCSRNCRTPGPRARSAC